MNDSVFQIPLYRRFGHLVPEYLNGCEASSIPYLTKATIIKNFPAGFKTTYLSTALSEEQVEYASTSGSSGARLSLVREREWWVTEFNKAYASSYELSEFNPVHDRKAVLASVVCSGTSCYLTPDADVQCSVGGVLHRNKVPNPHDWTRTDIETMLSELDRLKPKILEVNPSYLSIFISKIKSYGINTPVFMPRYVVTSYEFLTAYCRRKIESFFGTHVLDMYGSTELGVLFIQSADGNYHRCSHENILELKPVNSLERIYELVVTSWKNKFMPFLRYRTGDLVELKDPKWSKLKIMDGETFSIIQPHGRITDAEIFSDENRFLTLRIFDRLIEQCSWQPEFYRLEKRGACVDFYYVSSGQQNRKRDSENFKFLIELLRFERLTIHKVDTLQPDPSGKFSIFKRK